MILSTALVFPGQGSQCEGMGRYWYDNFSIARLVFQEVNEALGQDLSRLMFEGPLDELTLTQNAQPAIMAVSVAVARVLCAETGFDLTKSAFVAGHSLGEYSAHQISGTLSLSETAKLLRLRGDAMQRAVPVGIGAMAALIGPKASMALAEQACHEGQSLGTVVIANDNNEGQIVISGHKQAVERACEVAKSMGAKSMILPVSAPFHSPMMAPAALEMNEALAEIELKLPIMPIVTNVEATPQSDPIQLKSLLVEQVTARVRWRESVLWLGNEGKVSRFIELGEGKVLTGMIKRLCPEAQALSVNTMQDCEAITI